MKEKSFMLLPMEFEGDQGTITLPESIQKLHLNTIANYKGLTDLASIKAILEPASANKEEGIGLDPVTLGKYCFSCEKTCQDTYVHKNDHMTYCLTTGLWYPFCMKQDGTHCESCPISVERALWLTHTKDQFAKFTLYMDSPGIIAFVPVLGKTHMLYKNILYWRDKRSGWKEVDEDQYDLNWTADKWHVFDTLDEAKAYRETAGKRKK